MFARMPKTDPGMTDTYIALVDKLSPRKRRGYDGIPNLSLLSKFRET